MKSQFSFEDTESSIQLASAWSNVLDRIKLEVQEPVMARFIRPLTPISYVDRTVRLAAPGRFVQEWVRDRFLATLQSYLGDELGEPISIDLTAAPREKPEPALSTSIPVTSIFTPSANRFYPNPKYTFDGFIKGQSNRLALAGAQAVASAPGGVYNPLFIYGESGLGKTHLLHAIASSILERESTCRIAYVTAQQFAEEFVNALQGGTIEKFRRHYRDVHVWLIDDIQFIAHKDKTQEEIFHTFNFLHSLGKQIVLTSDRPPKDLFLLDERLRSRFESGLVADIMMPDTETRCAIIQNKATLNGIAITHEIADFLAQSVPGNIRTLEGAITKVAALASLEQVPITVEFAAKVVDQYYQRTVLKPGFPQIVDMVSQHFQIPVEEIRGASRKAPVVLARHVAIYLTRRITSDSWKHIGSLFGDRDHTSIMHGYQKIDEQMHFDKDLMLRVKSLMKSLHPGG